MFYNSSSVLEIREFMFKELKNYIKKNKRNISIVLWFIMFILCLDYLGINFHSILFYIFLLVVVLFLFDGTEKYIKQNKGISVIIWFILIIWYLENRHFNFFWVKNYIPLIIWIFIFCVLSKIIFFLKDRKNIIKAIILALIFSNLSWYLRITEIDWEREKESYTNLSSRQIEISNKIVEVFTSYKIAKCDWMCDSRKGFPFIIRRAYDHYDFRTWKTFLNILYYFILFYSIFYLVKRKKIKKWILIPSLVIIIPIFTYLCYLLGTYIDSIWIY